MVCPRSDRRMSGVSIGFWGLDWSEGLLEEFLDLQLAALVKLGDQLAWK